MTSWCERLRSWRSGNTGGQPFMLFRWSVEGTLGSLCLTCWHGASCRVSVSFRGQSSLRATPLHSVSMNSQNTAVLVMAILVTLGKLYWEEVMGSFMSVIEHTALRERFVLWETQTQQDWEVWVCRRWSRRPEVLGVWQWRPRLPGPLTPHRQAVRGAVSLSQVTSSPNFSPNTFQEY